MMCKLPWNTKFLEEAFGKSWVVNTKEGGYRYHRKMVALDRERSRIPETLAQLGDAKQRKKYEKRLRS